jgi:hypothetical protein
MPIKITCPNPNCRKTLTARDEMAGRKVKCPACGGAIAIPAAQDQLAELEEVPAAPPRRREPPPEDDYDDRPPPRRAPAGGGLFASKGLSAAGTIFTFVGVGLLLLLAISVFFPWRALSGGIFGAGEIKGFAFAQFPDMPDMPKIDMPKIKIDMGGKGFPGMQGASVTGAGIKTTGGLITLIVAIMGIAFVMVSLFALNQLVLKISLWTAFGLSIVGGLFGLLAALLKTTTFGITEGGAWGAWVAMICGLAAAVMFLLAVLGMRPVGAFAGARRPPRPPEDDDY